MIIGGWQGRVVELNNDLITFELDSITISQLEDYYITDSIIEGVEWYLLSLGIDEVEIVSPRDTKSEVEQKQKEINSRYSIDEEDNRISAILSSDNKWVNDANLQKYSRYLKKNIKIPSILTGTEVFNWEEPYIFGDWSNDEYTKDKETNASYTDQFTLKKLLTNIDSWDGIIVNVKRPSDGKSFDLPLSDLQAVDTNSVEHKLLSDYSYWITNFQE